MKIRNFSLILLPLLFLLFSCEKEADNKKDNNNKQYEVLIYGRDVCSNCERFINNCDKNNVQYTYYNVDEDSQKRSEMQQKCWEAGFGSSGSVTLPIVDVILSDTSYLFENPSIQEVLNLIP